MSDSGDVSMSDAEPEPTGPPSISIPDPPKLPALFEDDQGVVHPTVWRQHARHFVARYNKDFTGFDVRQKSGADSRGDQNGGTGDDDDDEEEDEEDREDDDADADADEDDDEDEDEDIQDADDWPYHLGPFTEVPQSSDVIKTWGLQLLEAAGFINCEQDDGDAYMDPEGRWAKTRNPHNLEAERIHPVFRKDMFQNITDDGYELMLPAILLASAWLDDPTTLNFFYGVWADEQHTSFWNVNLGHCTIVHVPQTLSEYSQRETHEKIVAMRNWTSWRIVNASYLVDRGAIADTGTKLDDSGKPVPASGPYTRQTEIHLSKFNLKLLHLFDHHVSTESQGYEKMLEDTLDLAGIPDSHKFRDFDLNSANMRTYFQLADAMIHEFAHAFNRAYYNEPDFLFAGPRDYKEPWVAGNRNNEMGFSLVKHVLGEIPWASTIWRIPMSHKEKFVQNMLCPFGFYSANRWDAGRGSTPAVREYVLPDLPVHQALERQIYYPLPQKHVNAMYTKEMWTEHVPRWGLAALKLPQPLAWAVI
ncbi:hypothetical protein KCU67_g7588, partial [Aureobasidium melanogenum]